MSTSSDTLAALTAAGVSIWLDDLDRGRLVDGNLAHLIAHDHVRGVTTNPTIFAKALSGAAGAYQDEVNRLAADDVDVETAVRTLTTDDVRTACDLFGALYQESGGVDGRVSLEVDPRLARNTEATIEQASTLWGIVDRPNALIKIPATAEGLPAITEVLGRGISVNVTLIFSLERYAKVIEAWLAGLERARDNGHDLRTIQSVASFFVSRMDSAVDARLDALGTPEAAALRGRAALASARLAWQVYTGTVSGPRWEALAAAGALPQRPLWASTGVKDPRYDDTRYVVDLVAPGCVNTMPEKTLRAVADHGVIIGDTVTDAADESREVWAGLEALGISEAEVCATLEDEGVTKFEDSWTELLDTVRRALAAAGDATRA